MNQDKQSEGNSKMMSLIKECYAITSKNDKKENKIHATETVQRDTNKKLLCEDTIQMVCPFVAFCEISFIFSLESI